MSAKKTKQNFILLSFGTESYFPLKISVLFKELFLCYSYWTRNFNKTAFALSPALSPSKKCISKYVPSHIISVIFYTMDNDIIPQNSFFFSFFPKLHYFIKYFVRKRYQKLFFSRNVWLYFFEKLLRKGTEKKRSFSSVFKTKQKKNCICDYPSRVHTHEKVRAFGANTKLLILMMYMQSLSLQSSFRCTGKLCCCSPTFMAFPAEV